MAGKNGRSRKEGTSCYQESAGIAEELEWEKCVWASM